MGANEVTKPDEGRYFNSDNRRKLIILNHVLPHPDSEVPDVRSLLQGRGGLFFGQLGDEVLGVVGRLRLHGRPDRSGHATRLRGHGSRRVVDHPQPHVVARFLAWRGKRLSDDL